MASIIIQQPTTKARHCNLHFIRQIQGIYSPAISQRTLSVLSSLPQLISQVAHPFIFSDENCLWNPIFARVNIALFALITHNVRQTLRNMNFMFMDPCIVIQISQKEPKRCNRIVEFIIPKFLNCSTCFGRHTAHHQEHQNCNYSLWFYIRFWLPAAAMAQPSQRPATKNVCKTRGCNYSF